jgi:hypothetical protein
MADLSFSHQQCADHCLHTGGNAPSGGGQCCFCGFLFALPIAIPSVTSGTHAFRVGKGLLGPAWTSTIKTAGGNRNS